MCGRAQVPSYAARSEGHINTSLACLALRKTSRKVAWTGMGISLVLSGWVFLAISLNALRMSLEEHVGSSPKAA